MGTLVEKLSHCCQYFSGVSGIADLSGEVFMITFKFTQLGYSTMFRKSNVNKTVKTFLVSLKYRENVTVKTVTFIRNFILFFLLKVLKE